MLLHIFIFDMIFLKTIWIRSCKQFRNIFEVFSSEYDDYNPNIDYDRVSYDTIEFQPRLPSSVEIEFGFDENNNEIEAVEGFGKDDLFLDHRQTRDRTSNDYEDSPGLYYLLFLLFLLYFIN